VRSCAVFIDPKKRVINAEISKSPTLLAFPAWDMGKEATS
jgi:hypothetical protein